MTLGNLSELTPFELNALVAEKVLGWRPVENHESAWFDEHGWMLELLPFDTDIRAAWRVVQKMRERGCVIRIFSLVDSWQVEFNKINETSAVVTDRSVTRAICEAALYQLDTLDITE